MGGFRGPRSGKETGDAYRKVGIYTVIPTMMVVGPVLGYFGGSWLEGRYGHEPWFTVGGMLLGFVASIRQIILVLKRGAEASEEDRSQ